MLGTHTYGGKFLRGPNSCEITAPNDGYDSAGLGRYPVNMLCVPRSCAASPWLIERHTVILSAICAVFARFWLKRTPSSFVCTVPSGPRYSTGANGFGSHDSW